MEGTESASSTALDESEQQRIRQLYDGLRQKLLDLTKKNRMLNYPLGARSKRHLQIFDEVPEEIYRLLVAEGASFETAPLPDPEDIPKDEKTEEFISALEHAKVSDVEYHTRLKALESTGHDDDEAIMAVERDLRERLRSQLGMPPRPKRIEINRNEHARNFRIDANPELPSSATKTAHLDKKLQTMKFPDELEAVMAKIADDARLSEQEMGVSTLFLAFGFLEWCEADASEKKYFAPLLLLPVTLDIRKTHGRKFFSLTATANMAESNLSLQKYLEREFGRILPDFESEDEDSEGSIEAYLSQAQNTIDGLHRWRIRRWIILGHFAFGRLAMYADLAPERWPHHPAANELLQTVLTGAEGGDATAFASMPDDYAIDDPEIEKIAPFLIHDADASQHSALVDVANGLNLVIQGPPGTGKSQTITNIISNVLAQRKKVLFLSEKQAALEVVKRRLDQAGLGEFCLEIHSDKSSSKQIIVSIKRRLGLGLAAPPPPQQPADPIWLASRRTISEYLNALHMAADDGRTPFQLIWQSVRGRSLHSDLIGSFKKVELPPALLDNPNDIAAALGQVEIYAELALNFHHAHGNPAESPWTHLGIDLLPQYEIGALTELLEEAKSIAENLLLLSRHNADLVSLNLDEMRRIAAAGPALANPPNTPFLAQVAQLDLDELERVLPLIEMRWKVSGNLRTKPHLAAVPIETMSRAVALTEMEDREELLQLKPAQLFDDLARRTDDLEAVIPAIEGLKPALGIVGLEESFTVNDLLAVVTAIIIVAKLRPELRPWINRFPDLDLEVFETSRDRWAALLAAENIWRSRTGETSQPWPSATAIAEAAKVVGRRGVGKLLGKFGGSERATKELIGRLGFKSAPTSDQLSSLASHVQALEIFVADEGMRNMFGSVWAGLQTPFREIANGSKVRRFLVDKLSAFTKNAVVIKALLSLDSEQLDALAHRESAAATFLMLQEKVPREVTDLPLTDVLSTLAGAHGKNRRILAIDPDRSLSAIELPVREIAAIARLTLQLREMEQSLSQSPLAVAAKSLAANDAQLRATRAAIDWIRSVRFLDVSPLLYEALLGSSAVAMAERTCRLGSELNELLVALDESVEGLRTRFGVKMPASADLEELARQLDSLLSHRGQLPHFLSLKAQRKIIESLGLRAFLDKADAIGRPAGKVTSALSTLLAHHRADQARRKHAALGEVAGALLDVKRRAFVDRDKKKINADRATIRSLLLQAKPHAGSASGPRKTWTEMALIRNEMEKEQRLIPVRTLFHRAHRSLQELMPCFMMSPLSLAKFLPAGNIAFDIAIIDEASQMKPEDALGGLLRAKQIVVVGDAKQLPPTDFFNRTESTVADEHEYEDLDDESILETCQKAFRQIRRLKWHYRSRCESLIAFSNREFYGNSLVTFPMARPGSFSVDLIGVNGTYQGRQNIAEALRVAEEAISFMRRHARHDEESLPTIGIAAVNIEQRDLIREELHRLSAGDDLVDAYQAKAKAKGEPLFIKNLENVQGDERDFILISMTYGREPGAGALKQRFGPINGKQGHRRLNVLFSRARQRIGLFTSFGSADVKPTEKSHEGVRVLQRYLEYAEGKGRAPVERLGVDADSDFELEVADRLRAERYDVDYQVGVSGYRIDLGVRHPDKPEMFLAGIECDGARYHSGKSARDRDRLREEVLVGLGWNILRVWSTDWFENPHGETRKLVLKLEKLRLESKFGVATEGYRFACGTGPGADAFASPAVEEEAPGANGGAVSARTSDRVFRTAAAANGHADPADMLMPILGSTKSISSNEASRVLREFRESVIAREITDWEPARSILRDGMIETFVTMRLNDPDDWVKRVPQYQRQNTNPIEKQKYLNSICQIVNMIEERATGS